MQKLKTYPRDKDHAPQTVPRQDIITRIKMVTLLEKVITIVEPQRKLANRIRETISAINPDHANNSDTQYRQQLVKSAYALRDLKEWVGYKSLTY